jgi:hypothetical protein
MKKKFENKLRVTRNKVSRKVDKYYSDKQKILSNKRLDEEEKKHKLSVLIKGTRKKIKDEFEHYEGFVYAETHTSPYEDFKYKERFKTTNTIMDLYQAKPSYDEEEFDNLIPGILDEPGVAGVQIIMKIKDKDGHFQYKSDFITNERLVTLEENEQTIFESLLEKVEGYGEYEQIAVFIKVVYEKAKV